MAGCVWADSGTACSADRLWVYSGRAEPTVMCGKHEQQFGVPQTGTEGSE